VKDSGRLGDEEVEIEHGGSVGYDWIPASAGMTEEGARDLSLPGVWGCPPIPKSPQEWGIKGVESEHVEVPAGFVSLYPSYNWLRQR
jgi:hypothetical protein